MKYFLFTLFLLGVVISLPTQARPFVGLSVDVPTDSLRGGYPHGNDVTDGSLEECEGACSADLTRNPPPAEPPPERRNPNGTDISLSDRDLQEFHEAVTAYVDAQTAGRRENETEEQFTERLRPLAAAAAQPTLRLVADVNRQAGTFGGNRVALFSSPRSITIIHLDTTGAEPRVVATVRITLTVVNGRVTGISGRVERPER